MKKPPGREAVHTQPASARFSRLRTCSLAGITAVLSTTAIHAQTWTGVTSSDWTDSSNWDPAGTVPTLGNTFISTVGSAGSSPYTAVISSSITAGELKVGFNDTTGRLDHTAGDVSGNGWQFVGGEGTGAGVGTYNIADTSGSGGTFSGFAQGSGGLTAARIYVGYQPSNGTLNVNTTGTLAFTEEFNVGDGQFAGSSTTGTLNLDSGTITAPIVNIGHQANGNGTVNMSGGDITATGVVRIGVTAGDGELTMTGGTITSPELFIGGNGGLSAIVTLEGGTINTSVFKSDGGPSDVVFDGTQFVATASGVEFLDFLATPFIDTGGLLVDTAGFSLSGNSPLDGTGGVTKSGAGSLSLLGDNTYAGDNLINEGTLVVAASSSGTSTGDFSVAANAGLGITTPVKDDIISPENVTFSGDGTLDLSFGSVGGTNPVNAPLNVTTNLDLGGTVTINIAGDLFAVGDVPLIDYTAKSGAGSIALGNLPLGVQGTLNDDGSTIKLVITSVSLPRWDGTVDNDWDTAKLNWVDQISAAASSFSNGDPVTFDDLAMSFTVAVPGTVEPASTIFSNTSGNDYALSGAGKIGGSGGLDKSADGNLSITGLANEYTGITTLSGGTTSVDSLTDGGTASSIGMAGAASSNLILNGGVLEYTGALATIDRGFEVTAANSGISTTTGLNLSTNDIVYGINGQLSKLGAGSLTFSNAGAVSLGTTGAAFSANGGTTTFDGGGTQVVGTGDLHVNREISATGTVLDLTNTTVNASGFRTGDDMAADTFTSTATINQTDSDLVVGDQIFISPGSGATTTWNINGTSTVVVGGPLRVGADAGTDTNAQGDIILNDTATVTANSWVTIGENGDDTNSGSVTLNDNSQFNIPSGFDFNIGDTNSGTGVVNVNDSASLDSPGQIFLGKNQFSDGTINMTGGTVTAGSWVNIAGVQGGSTGELNVSGGTFNHTATKDANSNINVGDHGVGEATVSGTGIIQSVRFVSIANNPTAFGTLNIGNGSAGGTIIAPAVRGGAGDSAVFFDGGTLQATVDEADFLNATLVEVFGGSGTIDSSTFTVTSAANIVGTQGGDLIKTGSGTLYLNGTIDLNGITTVSAGTLGGTGTLTGDLEVLAGASLAPGNSVGTLAAGTTFIEGDYAYEIDGASGDLLAVTGDLTLETGSTLTITELSAGSEAVYVVASYTGSLTGTFDGGITGLPSGWTIDYAYAGGTQIALINPNPSAYNAWIAGFYPGETDPAIIGSGADPDGDNQSNIVEFALGGAPDDGGNNAKIYEFAADSDADIDADDNLLMTIAVRSGTPAFAAGAPSIASHDGCDYAIEGSVDLATFGTGVTPATTPVVTDLPPAPTGYEYRTFSLDGSNGLPGKGFLRTDITETP